MPTLLVLVLAIVPSAALEKPPVPTLPGSEGRAESYFHYSLGLQARLAGDTDTALTEFQLARELDPSAAPVRVETARLYREIGRLDECSSF